jgi:hypothetical protein
MASGINSQYADAPWKPRGIGQGVTWRCGGCHQNRSSTAGSRGKGVMKRCSTCVKAKAERVAR